MKTTHKQVDATLNFIKAEYPESNDNGLKSHICARTDTPLSYVGDVEFLDQVSRARDWINWAKSFGLRQSINYKHSCYGIKHFIEKSEISKGYVTNMAAIVAFILEGVEITDHGNPRTNLSEKAFKR